jgi:hypothetical protein
VKNVVWIFVGFHFLCSTNQGIASLNLRARERSSGWTCYQIEEKKNVVQGKKKKIKIGLAQFFFFFENNDSNSLSLNQHSLSCSSSLSPAGGPDSPASFPSADIDLRRLPDLVVANYFEQIISNLDVWGSIHTLKDSSRFYSILFTIFHPVY